MTTAINYILSNYSDARFRGVVLDNASIDVLLDAIKSGDARIEGCVGGISIEYVDSMGILRTMPCESYRMRITRINSVIEVELTCVPVGADAAARYAVGAFECPIEWHPGNGWGYFNPTVQKWEREVVRPRAAAMVDAVWGEWAEAARHDDRRRFCTPESETAWLVGAIIYAARWAAYLNGCEKQEA